MKTGQLIEMLSANLEPARRGQIERTLGWALFIGGAAAFGVMLVTVGLQTDFTGSVHLIFLLLKLLFSLSLIGIGSALLIKATRPGQDARKLLRLIFIPFLAAGLAGLAAVAITPQAFWSQALLGMQWAACLFCIPLFAVIPFAVLIWALRKGAPTNLRLTGSIAGLVAGALGAAAYAFYCRDDSLLFIAIWYSVPIMLCAAAGALLGPRLLRW